MMGPCHPGYITPPQFELLIHFVDYDFEPLALKDMVRARREKGPREYCLVVGETI